MVKLEDPCKDTQIHGPKHGEPMRLKAWLASERQSQITHPYLDVLASVTRAIHQECPPGIDYNYVGCSPDHSLRGHEYRFWLKDHRPFTAPKCRAGAGLPLP